MSTKTVSLSTHKLFKPSIPITKSSTSALKKLVRFFTPDQTVPKSQTATFQHPGQVPHRNYYRAKKDTQSLNVNPSVNNKRSLGPDLDAEFVKQIHYALNELLESQKAAKSSNIQLQVRQKI